jgi:hypothetical protein
MGEYGTLVEIITDRGQLKYMLRKKNLSRCHFVHHMYWPGIEPAATGWDCSSNSKYFKFVMSWFSAMTSGMVSERVPS